MVGLELAERLHDIEEVVAAMLVCELGWMDERARAHTTRRAARGCAARAGQLSRCRV
jgi:hypothetical protein